MGTLSPADVAVTAAIVGVGAPETALLGAEVPDTAGAVPEAFAGEAEPCRAEGEMAGRDPSTSRSRYQSHQAHSQSKF